MGRQRHRQHIEHHLQAGHELQCPSAKRDAGLSGQMPGHKTGSPAGFFAQPRHEQVSNFYRHLNSKS